MYIIYRVDIEDGELSKIPVGVVNGDEAKAVNWMARHNLEEEKTVNSIPYPHLQKEYVKELEEDELIEYPIHKLTEEGKRKCDEYISKLKTKREKILNAGLDTANETSIDFTAEELFKDLLSLGIDEDGEIYNSYGVTDNYDADTTLFLKLGVDFTVSNALEEDIEHEL